MNSIDFGIDLTGTVSGSGDDIEITGTFTGEILGGSGTFRMVPTAATFGTLSAIGTVDEVDISIDTEFALGRGRETEIRYIYDFPLTAGWFSGTVRLQTNSELIPGKTYTVVDGEPWEDDLITVNL